MFQNYNYNSYQNPLRTTTPINLENITTSNRNSVLNNILSNSTPIKKSLISNLTSGKFNIGSILNNTQKTLGIINQTIPIINQVKPIWNNAKTMFKIMNVLNSDKNSNQKEKILKESEREKQTIKTTTSTPQFYI